MASKNFSKDYSVLYKEAMRFSIITPTYRRGEALTRAVASLSNQTYKDWEMIIINDSPGDRSYDAFASSINDPRIHYKVNDTNRGVNYSRNRGLQSVTVDSRYVIFLDDDDYFAPDTIKTLHDLVLTNQDYSWFVTNRALRTGAPLTKFPHNNKAYSYARDYLLLRRCKGDATHCIETKLATSASFSTLVKQGEEWFYFFQLGQHTKMFYHDHNSTISDGYDQVQGLNFRKRTRSERFETLMKLFYESRSRITGVRILFIVYMFVRLLRLAIK